MSYWSKFHIHFILRLCDKDTIECSLNWNASAPYAIREQQRIFKLFLGCLVDVVHDKQPSICNDYLTNLSLQVRISSTTFWISILTTPFSLSVEKYLPLPYTHFDFPMETQKLLKDVLAAIKDKAATGSHVAVPILKFISSVADVFPPLKSAAGGALHISQITQVRFHMRIRHERPLTSWHLQDYRGDKQEWKDFGDYVQEMVAEVVVRSLQDSNLSVFPWSDRIQKLETSVYLLGASVCDYTTSQIFYLRLSSVCWQRSRTRLKSATAKHKSDRLYEIWYHIWMIRAGL
jgi:hypothetical protein